ncbi:MAG: hypothetical protein Kow002_00210 [Anaerolineales bacterium]
MNTSHKTFWQTIIVFTFGFSAWTLYRSVNRLLELGASLTGTGWILALVIYLVVMLACVWTFWKIRRGDMTSLLNVLELKNVSNFVWRISSGLLFLLTLWGILFIKFHFGIGREIENPGLDPQMLKIVYYWLIWWMLLLAVIFVKVALNKTWDVAFLAALILLGIAYEFFNFYKAVNTYPLSLSWSEGSRYFYASLFFSKSLYGEIFPLSTLHPTRYFLQSLAFLIPDQGIAWHRLWQVLLWIFLTGGTVWALLRRVRPKGNVPRILLAGWLILYILRVGVYYHLAVMVILPLLLVSAKHPWRSLITIILASIWAGVSRVNWIPVPAMIAIAIYLLEEPVSNSKSWLAYLKLPALWTIFGLLFAFGAQAAYIPLSGNLENSAAFTSSFTSDLLWYRLWPNELYSLGIVPGLLLVSAPLLTILILAARKWRQLHPVRWLGLGLMLLVLFAGGVVASTKIGGGDMHNMDAFASLLSVVAIYFIGQQVRGESDAVRVNVRAWPYFALTALVFVLFLVANMSPPAQYDSNDPQYLQFVKKVNSYGREAQMLFINERQLVTFGDVDVRMIPEHEAVTLMEMAMSRNETYLSQFYDELESNRFDAIVAWRQTTAIKESGLFIEENNVWNSLVSPFILCTYRPEETFEIGGRKVVLYVPRDVPKDCPR